MTKIITSVSIDLENYNYAKDRKINISEWVNSKMKEEFVDKEKKIKELEKEMSDRNKELIDLKKEVETEKKEKQNQIKNLSQEQIKELKESIKIIKERGNSFFEGRYNRYKNMFDSKLTIKGFEELLRIVVN